MLNATRTASHRRLSGALNFGAGGTSAGIYASAATWPGFGSQNSTVCAWCYTTSVTSNYLIHVGNNGFAVGNVMGCVLFPTEFSCGADTNGTGSGFGAAGVPANNEWYFVFLTSNATTATCGYIDPQAGRGSITSTTFATTTTTSNISVGFGNYIQGGNSWGGYMAGGVSYARPLSLAELIRQSQQLAPLFEDAVSYVLMNGGATPQDLVSGMRWTTAGTLATAAIALPVPEVVAPRQYFFVGATAPASPTQSPVSLPDALANPSSRAAAWQAAFAKPVSPPIPTPGDDQWQPRYPDALPLPALAKASVPAATSEPPAPERTSPLASESHADSASRPFLGAAAQLAPTGLPPAPEVRITADWQPGFPEKALRPALPPASHPAYASAVAPERTTVPAFEHHPDSAPGASLHASRQPFATGEQPLPEALLPADWQPAYPPAASRPAFPAPVQPYFALAPLPILNPAAPLGSGSLFPDSAPRPAVPASEQPSFGLGPAPISTPFGWPGSFPDSARGAPFPAPEQQAPGALSALPIPNPSAPLGAAGAFPDSARGAFLSPAAFPAFATSPAPERAQALASASFPDRVERALEGAPEQPSRTEVPPRPERYAPLAADVHADSAPGRFLSAAAAHAAPTAVEPRPEAPAPLAGQPAFPASLPLSATPAVEQHSFGFWPLPIPKPPAPPGLVSVYDASAPGRATHASAQAYLALHPLPYAASSAYRIVVSDAGAVSVSVSDAPAQAGALSDAAQTSASVQDSPAQTLTVSDE